MKHRPFAGRAPLLGGGHSNREPDQKFSTDDLAHRFEKRNARYRKKGERYTTTMLAGLTLSLLVITLLFRVPYQPYKSFNSGIQVQELVMIEEIEQTRHLDLIPPPPRPQIPVLVANDEILEREVILFDSELELDRPVAADLPPPPVRVEEETIDEDEIFVVVEEMPEIVGGVNALYSVLEYPEIARRAGVQGMVVVQITIEADGKPSDPAVVRSAGSVLDQAALNGVMKLSFIPGRQRGQAVRVRFALPVQFRLTEA